MDRDCYHFELKMRNTTILSIVAFHFHHATSNKAGLQHKPKKKVK